MKVVTKLFLTLCLVAGLGATLSANAQIESDVTIKANIPHPFVVHNTRLPAGTYTVAVADRGSEPDLNVLEIRSANGKTTVLFDTEPITEPRVAKHSELMFDKIGDTYFLSRVFLRGDEGGNQAVKSKTQRRLEEGGAIAERHSIAASPMQVKSSKQTARK